jgi:hypothetical protein
MPSPHELLREPTESEYEFFRDNPSVGGMASEDDRIIMNPDTSLSPEEQRAVQQNEWARIQMRQPGMTPQFSLSAEQASTLNGLPYYDTASDEDRRSTIAARLYSGDPSGGKATPEQQKYLSKTLTMPGDGATTDEIMDGYSHLNFVQRVLDPNRQNIPNDDGSVSSHRMAAEVDGGGNWFVFPTIIETEEGKLREFETNQDAMDYAMQTGEFIPFDKDGDKAQVFAKNGYKSAAPDMQDKGGRSLWGDVLDWVWGD